MGKAVSVQEGVRSKRIEFGTSKYYAENKGDKIEFYVDNKRSISMTVESASTAGGILHGMWRSDESVTSSDKRLKMNISPLHSHLDEAALKRGVPPEPGAADADKSTWVLRQLRPVSFSYRKPQASDSETSKSTRFGFIAQDLERVLPELVRTLNSKPLEGEPTDKKAVVYQDLIAVLAAASQSQQRTIEQQQQKLEEQERVMKGQQEKLQALQDETREGFKSLKEDMSSMSGAKDSDSADDMRLRVLTLENQMSLVMTQLSKAAAVIGVIK